MAVYTHYYNQLVARNDQKAEIILKRNHLKLHDPLIITILMIGTLKRVFIYLLHRWYHHL